eukprot:5145197-Prymnesium_polylepis.1
MPSEAHHDTAVWDDLLRARQRMVHVLRVALRKNLDGKAETAERDTLLREFDSDAAACRIATLEAAARAARLQGNFGAAEVYLKALPELRKALGIKADVGHLCAVLSLKLDRC